MKKPSRFVCEEFLQSGDVCVFKDETVKLVEKYNEFKHMVTFEGEKPVDLWQIYDDIIEIHFLNANGKISFVHQCNAVTNAIRFINHATKYKAYLETILAFINGDKDHYIAEYACDFEFFGFTYMSKEQLLDIISFEIDVGLVKPKKSKRGKIYFSVRKDGKRWRIKNGIQL